MTKKATGNPKSLHLDMSKPETNGLKRIGGSESDGFNLLLVNSVIRTVWMPTERSEEDRERQYAAVVTALAAFNPADEIEGLLAAQAIAMHHASMECSRRAMHPDQPFEAAQGFRKAAANASRCFTELLSALDRKRGKAVQQRVVVERVVVNPGGQAIVGAVAPGGPGGGCASQSSGEPRVPPAELAHDPSIGPILPTVRSAVPERDPVPATGDAGQEPVPISRRA